MALNADTMATALYTAMEPTLPDMLKSGAPHDSFMAWLTALSTGIITHLSDHADVRVKTTDAGLQRDPAGSHDPTLGPAADVVLAGALE